MTPNTLLQDFKGAQQENKFPLWGHLLEIGPKEQTCQGLLNADHRIIEWFVLKGSLKII